MFLLLTFQSKWLNIPTWCFMCFSSEKIAEATRRFSALQSELDAFTSHANQHGKNKMRKKVPAILKSKTEEKSSHRLSIDLLVHLNELK